MEACRPTATCQRGMGRQCGCWVPATPCCDGSAHTHAGVLGKYGTDAPTGGQVGRHARAADGVMASAGWWALDGGQALSGKLRELKQGWKQMACFGHHKDNG